MAKQWYLCWDRDDYQGTDPPLPAALEKFQAESADSAALSFAIKDGVWYIGRVYVIVSDPTQPRDRKLFRVDRDPDDNRKVRYLGPWLGD